jgi:hypothetical protein
MAKASSKRLDARARSTDACAQSSERPLETTFSDSGIARTMMNISDYLVDWAEQVRALAAAQRDSKMQQKLVALAEECGRITLLMEPERQITRLN